MRNFKLPNDPELAAKMRLFAPKPGNDFDKFLRVEMQPGDNISEHAHKRHTVLYYPQRAEAVIIKPEAGTMLYLAPGTLHEVPTTRNARTSIAMIVGL